ncbi:MAG: hypothetical protein E6980_16415 [Clostridium sp.]|uniref:hypothetical protein n=1 Tax=Clostridium sp. TaxID=1506 RepID=UPI0029035789|nr:hypothetical protein [Clostridium sp.]MDU1231742.1 hypothetical protein [Clostridium sp.]
MNSQVKSFEGQDVRVQTDEGVTLINLASTAKVCGLTRIANSGNEVVRWKNGTEGVTGKLEKIRATDLAQEIKEEITYILDEIENTDDRNSIYMSSWLSKRLAIECHSEKANRFKNWLVTLDEARENGRIVHTNSPVLDEAVISNMNLIAQNMNFMSKAITGIKEYVQDSIQAKDKQIDDIAELIGIRTKNKCDLINIVKNTLVKKFNLNHINANMEVYKRAKQKIFKEFNVNKWEDISATKYNAVQAFIEECL